jgi:hypothetical protein
MGIHALLRVGLRDTPADRARWESRWNWQCWENPFREGRPVGWVMTEGERLIGHLGAVYVPWRVGGPRCLAVIVSCYCVAPDAAARGGVLLGLQLAQAFFDSAKATACLPMAASANEKTGAVFARFGCKPVKWTREFYRMPAGLAGEIRACWGARSRVARRLLTAAPCRPLCGLIERAYASLRRHPRIPLPPGQVLEENRDLDGWPAPLGLLDKQCAAGMCGVERSEAYFNWRYCRHPECERFGLLALRSKQGELVGAAIVSGGENADQRLAVVEDVIAPAGRPDVVRALLCAALRWASRRRLEYLTTMAGRSDCRPLYWELGFESRARSAPAVVIPSGIITPADGGAPAASMEQGPELWHGAMF